MVLFPYVLFNSWYFLFSRQILAQTGKLKGTQTRPGVLPLENMTRALLAV